MSAQRTRLFHRLQIAAHRLQKAADREIASVADLTTAQAAVLAVLSGSESRTQKDIATALRLNESAVTAMVNRLLRLGYVNRERSPSDGRAWRLELTAEGQTVLKTTRPPFDRINRIMEATLTADEIDKLADYLMRLADAFEDR